MKVNNIKDQDDIISYLSIKYNIDTDIINKIVRNQFKFIKETMEMGELQSVHLHYFGKMAIKPGRYKALIEEGDYEVKKKIIK